MRNRGKLTIETANTFLDESYSTRHEDVTPGQYVMLAVTDTGSGTSWTARSSPSLPPRPSARGPGSASLEASDGSTALRMLGDRPDIDLLFTDVGLPGGLNGRQLADEARQRHATLKVLFTTGYARNAIVHQGRLDPGVELIVKPFTYSALAKKIRQVVDGES